MKPLSKAAQDARRPLPPEVLACPEGDAGRPVEGRGRAAKTAPRKFREPRYGDVFAEGVQWLDGLAGEDDHHGDEP